MTSVESSIPRWSRSLIKAADALVHLGAGLILHRLEDAAMVIPAAVIDDRERHSHFRQTTCEQKALAEVVHAVGLADRLGLLGYIKRRLRTRRGHQLKALPVKCIEANGGIFCCLRRDSLHGVERLAQLLAGECAAFADGGGHGYITNPEVSLVGLPPTTKGAC
jgi:hypothetical protein